MYTFEETLDGGVQVLLVEGKEEIGKTTLLAQFAKRHANGCISLFIRSSSRFSYDPAVILRDMCGQAHFIAYREEYPAEADADESALQRLLYRLVKAARRERNALYFVVDGLECLREGCAETRDVVLSLLPIGVPGFKFIITGSESLLRGYLKGVQFKEFTVPGFTFEEAIAFFDGYGLDKDTVNQLYRTFSTVPGRLESARRLLDSGIAPDALLQSLPDALPGLFEIEWRTVSQDNRLLLDLLTLISSDARTHSLESLGCIFGYGQEELHALLKPMTFLSISEREPFTVAFVSEPFRRFAASKLSHLRDEVREKVIWALFSKPESDEALALLPGYLKEAGEREKLLEYLSPQHLAAMIDKSESLTLVRQRASLGVATALATEQDSELLRFGIYECAIADLDGSEVSRSEVQARIAVGEYRAAVELAQGVTIIQDRLRLLAAIARFQREQGLSPEAEILEQMQHLFSRLDPAELGPKSFELASDLMYSRPELAIKLIEGTIPSGPDDRAFDWALARLSIDAALSQKGVSTSPGDKTEELRHRIKDPGALRFTTEVAALLGKYSPKEVIAEAEKLDKESDRIFLLRRWASSALNRQGAAPAVEYALKIAIRTTTHKPTATDFRELATPLPFIRDEAEMKRLAEMFKAQKGLVELSGPTLDYVSFQLLLCQAQARYDREGATTELMEVYDYVCAIADIEVRAGALARLFSATKKIDPELKLKDSRDIRETALSDLNETVVSLLSSTADHYAVTRHVLEALADSETEVALEIAATLNVEPRRDRAILEVVRESLQQRVEDIPYDAIQRALSAIVDRGLKDQALLTFFERLDAASDHETISTLDRHLLPFVDRVSEIRENHVRCLAACHALNILSHLDGDRYEGLSAKTLSVLNASWAGLEDGWRKVHLGFEIVEHLAAHFRESALEYLVRSQSLREQLGLDYEVGSYVACLRLAIRAFAGLFPNDLDSSEDYERLRQQIGRVPSILTQAGLWSDLALRAFKFGREPTGKKLVSEYVRPLIGALKDQESFEWAHGLVTVAPSLYLAHHATTLDLVRSLPGDLRDEAVDNIIDFVMRKSTPFDPFDTFEAKCQVSFAEAVDVCDLLREVESDSLLYRHMANIVDSAIWRHNREPFNQNQQLEIARRLTELIDLKLPNPRFITHEGYKVIAQAQVARLRRQTRGSGWQNILEAGENVPNRSDKSYVLACLADIGSSPQLFEGAKSLADNIPSLLDRVDRYESIARYVHTTDGQLAKQLLRDACALVTQSSDPDVWRRRRQIVDLAYRLDPDLASSLAASFDDDEARADARRQVEMQTLRKELSDNPQLPIERLKADRSLPRAAWMVLASLNANRLSHRPVKETRNLIQAASVLRLRDSYPVFALVIENAVQRRAQSGEAKRFLRKMFEATLLGCELTFLVAVRPSKKRRTQSIFQQSASMERKIIRARQRSEAIEYLRRWLRDNATGYLKICEPYFSPRDLEILQLVLESAPALTVQVLTSRKNQDREKVNQPWGGTYRRYWHENFSEQEPPPTDIYLVGTGSGDHPLHDRWWVTRGRGLRFGTSFNNLGISKDSEIADLSEDEIKQREAEIDEYFYHRKREHLGKKLFIESFTL